MEQPLVKSKGSDPLSVHVGGSIMAPPKTPGLIPKTCGCVRIHGQRDFADVVKLGTSEWTQTILDYPNRSNVITRVLESRRGRRKSERKTCV